MPQKIAHEILATYKVQQKKSPTIPELRELILEEIERRFSDQPDVRDIFIAATPSRQSIMKWRRKEGWEEAVWQQIKTEGLFTAERRSKVINKLFDKAVGTGGNKPDTTAAKLWLTMSGDYSEKLDVHTNEVVEQYREINKQLHSRKYNVSKE